MKQTLTQIALLVKDYDEAIDFYVNKMGFVLAEDTMLSETKRWVRVLPPGSDGAGLLLAKAANEQQQEFVGNQSGGRVFLFLHTDDLTRDHERYTKAGIEFVREPVTEAWGKVAVLKDLYGNLWDIIEPANK